MLAPALRVGVLCGVEYRAAGLFYVPNVSLAGEQAQRDGCSLHRNAADQGSEPNDNEALELLHSFLHDAGDRR